MTREVKPLVLWERTVYRLIRFLVEAICRVLWRMEVNGRERLPAAGAFIVAPVHRSNIDFFVVGGAVNRIARFMAKDSIWKPAWFGRFLEHMGTFPVHRDRPDRNALRAVETALQQGSPVVMFPEGRRMEGPRVHELLEGPAWVATRNRVPIVPVGLGNTAKAMPIGSKFMRPVKVTVEIGEPIYPDVPVTGRVPRGAVAELTETLREAIQRQYDIAEGVAD